jgi:hypothetical protein
MSNLYDDDITNLNNSFDKSFDKSFDESFDKSVDDSKRLQSIKTIMSIFSNDIQKEYINNYTPYFEFIENNKVTNDKDKLLPQTISYKKIKSYFEPIVNLNTQDDFINFSNNNIDKNSYSKNSNNEIIFKNSRDNLKQKYNPNIFDLYEIINLKDNLCNLNNQNINCHIGNLNYNQLKNVLLNGFKNVVYNLNKNRNIKKPFGKGKLDLLKYISIICSKDSSHLNNYDEYIKNHIGKDQKRDVIFINNHDISHFIKNNNIFPHELKEFNKVSNTDYTNVIALYILGLLNEYSQYKDDIYDILIKILLLLHQGIFGEIDILTKNFTNQYVNEINDINGETIVNNIITNSSSTIEKYIKEKKKKIQNKENINEEENEDTQSNIFTPYEDAYNKVVNKYTYIIINGKEISLYVVLYYTFSIITSDGDIFNNGNNLGVLHFDILNNTYEFKYFINNFSLHNPNINIPTKYQQLKENINENKGKIAIGSTLGLLGLSAIPIMLLLGGNKTKKNKGGKQRKIKTYRHKKYLTRHKKYNNKKRNKKRKTLKHKKY